MARTLSGLACGVLFGAGLALGGMTLPAKVIGFLDVAGAWDPSLAMVMLGAIAVYAPAYRFLVARTTPLFVREFALQASKQIDGPLVGGAVLFGVGWGMAGYCPGPALVALGTAAPEALSFTASMVVGMAVFLAWEKMRARPSATGAASRAA